jgi:hypothetical protein
MAVLEYFLPADVDDYFPDSGHFTGTGRGYVYFAWRGTDLLYAGITTDPRRRFVTGQAAHSKVALWWGECDGITCDDIGTAYNELAATELLAVQVAKPLHNGAKKGHVKYRRYDDCYWVSAGNAGLHCRVPEEYEWCLHGIGWKSGEPEKWPDEKIRERVFEEWHPDSSADLAGMLTRAESYSAFKKSMNGLFHNGLFS